MQTMLLSLLALVATCYAAENTSNTSVFGVICNTTDLSKLCAAVKKAGLDGTLSTMENITLFAPKDSAWSKNESADADILKHHVLGVVVKSKDLVPLQFPIALDNTPLKISKDSSGVEITFDVDRKEAKVVQADVSASNGIIHVVDAIILPPANASSVADVLGLTELLKLVERANLTKTVAGKDLTILAPTDAAFKAYFDSKKTTADDISVKDLQNLLTEHVFSGVFYSTEIIDMKNLTSLANKTWDVKVSDNQVSIGGAIVIKPNVLVVNGVVHVIDRVLGGPAPPSANSDELSTGAVVGIVLGVLAATACIGYVCFKSGIKRDDDYQRT